MKLSTNIIFQTLAMIVQVGNQYSGLVPAKYQGIVLAVVALAQAIVALHAHNQALQATPPNVKPAVITTLEVK